MKINNPLSTLMSMTVTVCATCGMASQASDLGGTTAADAATAIRALIARYIASIDGADTKLGAKVWSQTASVTFIHPLGHEHGWEQVKQNFYIKTMGDNFAKRDLKTVGDVSVQVYGTAAVVEFDWDFNATWRKSGRPQHSSGRESQVYADLPGEGWRLVQVHYSGPALKPGDIKGF